MVVDDAVVVRGLIVRWVEAEGAPFAAGNPYVGPEAIGGMLAKFPGIIDGFQVAFGAAIVGLLLISLMRAAPPGPLTPAPVK